MGTGEIVKRAISNGSEAAEQVSVDPKKSEGTITHWLMKSEPESRFENGVDVKVSFAMLYRDRSRISEKGCFNPQGWGGGGI